MKESTPMTVQTPVTTAPTIEAPASAYAETVTSVQHYTDRLFKFRMTRPAAFRFRSGEFVMIGLPGEKPVWRAYSVACPAWDEELEFFSIKVPDGPLTSELQKIRPGDTVWMKKKPTGTLVLDALLPGERLYMFSTGTGVAPFASLIREPETYEKFRDVILTHTCREADELAYGREIVEAARACELVGEEASAKLRLVSVATRDPVAPGPRITEMIESGSLFAQLGVPRLNPATDRVMICGSMAMLKDIKALCEAHGLTEGSNSQPGQFVIERAFVG
jgi:ferredoxin--NADP+ reductase